jgi:hypothetical protein
MNEEKREKKDKKRRILHFANYKSIWSNVLMILIVTIHKPVIFALRFVEIVSGFDAFAQGIAVQ